MTDYPDILQGEERRYHIVSVVATTPYGIVYRAYSRRPAGRSILRRYYAVLQPAAGRDVDMDRFMKEMYDAVDNADSALHVEECVECDGKQYFVVDRGRRRRVSSKGKKHLFRIYIAILLAALIVVLLVVRCSMAPASSDTAPLQEADAMEAVDAADVAE